MIFKMCAFGILSLVLMLLVKELGWRGAPLIGICTLLCAVSLVIPSFTLAKEYYFSIAGELGISDIAAAVLKLIGLGYVVGIVADICRDMGEGMIARAVLLVGRIEIIMICAPYFIEVVRIGVSLL